MINKSIPNFAFLSDYEWIALKNPHDSQEIFDLLYYTDFNALRDNSHPQKILIPAL